VFFASIQITENMTTVVYVHFVFLRVDEKESNQGLYL